MNTQLDTQGQAIVRRRQVMTWVWTGVSFFIALAAVLVLSTIDGEDGKPILENSLLLQVISTFGLIASVTVPALLGARKDAAVVRDQVENTHVDNPNKVSNVRDDMDHKHSDVMNAVAELALRMDNKFENVAKDIRGVRTDVGRVADQGMRTQDAIVTLAGRVDRNRDSVEIVTKALEVRIETLEKD